MFSVSLPVRSSSPRRLIARALLLCGGLLALWLVVQFTPLLSATPASTGPASTGPASTGRTNPVSQEGAARAVVSAASAQPPRRSGGGFFSWGNAAAVLLLVAGGAAALYLRQYGTGQGSETVFRSGERFSLGQVQRLQLVECSDEVLLLGVTREEVTLIKAYPREAFDSATALMEEGDTPAGEAPRGLLRGEASAASEAPGFSEMLRQLARQGASA